MLRHVSIHEGRATKPAMARVRPWDTMPSFFSTCLAYTLDGTLKLAYVIEYRPMTEFSYDFGEKRLVSLDPNISGGWTASFAIPGQNERFDDCADGETLGFTEGQGKLVKVSAAVDMQSRLTVGCAGAVLAYIGRHSPGNRMPGGEGSKLSCGIKSIRMFNLDKMM